MSGNDKIIRCKILLSPAEMQKAVQHYLATVLFREGACPKVVTFREAGYTYDRSYEIELADAPEA